MKEGKANKKVARIGRVRLTEREVELIRLLPEELTAREMGSRLCVSGRTVHVRLVRLYKKVGVHDRDGLICLALTSGLIADRRKMR